VFAPFITFTQYNVVMGILKGYDGLLNLVLDDAIETLHRPQHLETLGDSEHITRILGLLVCRGPSVVMIAPEDGSAEIPNPFLCLDE
jgi:U6 snRNA-associated Sm-like protein LSm7